MMLHDVLLGWSVVYNYVGLVRWEFCNCNWYVL